MSSSLVDRIYEKWLCKFNKNFSVLSSYDAPIGHNKDDVIVPLYPVYTHQQMFKKSFEFGYDYDDVDENGKYTWSSLHSWRDARGLRDSRESAVLFGCIVYAAESREVWVQVNSLAASGLAKILRDFLPATQANNGRTYTRGRLRRLV